MTRIERLDRERHVRAAFHCGNEQLDRFLHETAHQAFVKNVAVTYVAVDDANPSRILGYYTLSSHAIVAHDIPESERKRRNLPRHSSLVPSTILGRLGIARDVQGKGLGSLLLMDALARSYAASFSVASLAVVVDAIEEGVVPFYTQYGFRRFSETSRKLYVMMDTIAKIPQVQEAAIRNAAGGSSGTNADSC